MCVCQFTKTWKGPFNTNTVLYNIVIACDIVRSYECIKYYMVLLFNCIYIYLSKWTWIGKKKSGKTNLKSSITIGELREKQILPTYFTESEIAHCCSKLACAWLVISINSMQNMHAATGYRYACLIAVFFNKWGQIKYFKGAGIKNDRS